MQEKEKDKYQTPLKQLSPGTQKLQPWLKEREREKKNGDCEYVIKKHCLQKNEQSSSPQKSLLIKGKE